MKREFDKTERQRDQIKRSNKAILEKTFCLCLSGVQPFRFFVFVFVFFVLSSLIFAKNSVMKQNRWGPLIC